jgi:hypothetical protein
LKKDLKHKETKFSHHLKLNNNKEQNKEQSRGLCSSKISKKQIMMKKNMNTGIMMMKKKMKQRDETNISKLTFNKT